MAGSSSASAYASQLPEAGLPEAGLPETGPIPVILDTDLGVDIDDHFAVAMALGSPEFDIKLITVTSGDVEHRANLLAQLLVAAGRTDIPIAIGIGGQTWHGFDDAELMTVPERDGWKRYPGPVSTDAAGEIVRVVNGSSEPVTIITICQVTTLAAALDRDPGIVDNSRVVSMSTWLRKNAAMSSMVGPNAPEPPCKDANGNGDEPAFRRLLESGWDLTIAPTEICFDAIVSGARWDRFVESGNPVAQLLMRHYREWLDKNGGWGPDMHLFDFTASERSSWLWDTVAVAMAYGSPTVGSESLLLTMGEDEIVREDPHGRAALVATSWVDLDGFLEELSTRVLAARV
jgi:inosine-uridine nucleoside N-ribohydrolase